MSKEQQYLRVGSKLYRGRDGGMDFSNHRRTLEQLEPDAKVEILSLEIINGDDPMLSAGQSPRPQNEKARH